MPLRWGSLCRITLTQLRNCCYLISQPWVVSLFRSFVLLNWPCVASARSFTSSLFRRPVGVVLSVLIWVLAVVSASSGGLGASAVLTTYFWCLLLRGWLCFNVHNGLLWRNRIVNMVLLRLIVGCFDRLSSLATKDSACGTLDNKRSTLNELLLLILDFNHVFDPFRWFGILLHILHFELMLQFKSNLFKIGRRQSDQLVDLILALFFSRLSWALVLQHLILLFEIV